MIILKITIMNAFSITKCHVRTLFKIVYQYSGIPGFKNEISRKSYVKILSGLNSSNNLVKT